MRIPTEESLTITNLSNETIEKLNKLLDEGKKPVKKPFPHLKLDSIMIGSNKYNKKEGDIMYQKPEELMTGRYIVYSNKYNGYVTDFTLGAKSSQQMSQDSNPNITCYTGVSPEPLDAYPFTDLNEARFVAKHWNVEGTIFEVKGGKQ